MTLWQVVSYIGVIGIVAVAFMNPRLFVFNVASVIVSPLFVALKVFIVAFQRMHKYHFKDSEFRITSSLFLILKLRTLIWKTLFFTVKFFNDLVGEEMIKIPSAKPVTYVPVADRNEEVKTTFEFKRIETDKLAAFQDEMVGLNKKGQANRFLIRSTRLKITREMLCGWDNLLNADGVPVKFDPSKKALMYDMLGPDLQSELEARFGDGSLDWGSVEAKLEADAAEESAALVADSDDEE